MATIPRIPRPIRFRPAAGERLVRGAWRDPQFLAACAAAPAVWIGLAASGLPLRLDVPSLASWHGAWLVAAGPILEELAFRGGLQPAARNALDAILRPRPAAWTANLLTSVAFAALHLPTHPPAWAAAVFVPSLAFGHFRDRHDGLASPIALHVFYNAGYFALFG